jgi:hypothetical protein
MAVPTGWTQQGNNYTSTITVGKETFKVQTNGSGTYEVFDSQGNKAFSQNPSQANAEVNRGILGVGDSDKFNALSQSEKDSLLKNAKSETYTLTNAVATDQVKSDLSQSEAYKSLAADKVAEQTAFDSSGYKATDVGVGEIAKVFSLGILKYPLDMPSGQDRIKFTAVEIEKGGFASGDIDSFSAPKVSYKKVDSSIYIATQGPIQDQTLVSWGEGKMDAIEAFKYNAAMTGMTAGPGQMIEKAAEDIAGSSIKYKGEITQMLAGQAAGINNILARTQTKVLNPNLELLFEGPQLRPFTFQFDLSARSSGEATAIKFIIKYFKRHMAVRKEASIFLKAPHVFTIQYQKGASSNLGGGLGVHPSINLISPQVDGTTKACALQSMNVDYSPLGQYATYNDGDGTMVKYTINLTFQEIEPIYDTDYFQDAVGSKHSIGY